MTDGFGFDEQGNYHGLDDGVLDDFISRLRAGKLRPMNKNDSRAYNSPKIWHTDCGDPKGWRAFQRAAKKSGLTLHDRGRWDDYDY